MTAGSKFRALKLKSHCSSCRLSTMGKSPGKWIKTVLFGKKSSKSYVSKGVTSEKRPAAKVPASDLTVNPSVISDAINQNIDRGGEKTELENDTTNRLPCNAAVFPAGTQDVDSQIVLGTVSTDAALEWQAQAATKAQAAFRGYLARRAFLALKGIIRLQALIHGHLVRRQAVATLRCTQAIVRIQALARGKRVRVSDSGHQVLGKNSLGEHKDAKPADSSVICISERSEKLATNAFVRKLLAVMPRAMPLSLQYDVVEPNSAWNWLDRWSLYHFWTPFSRPKKSRDAKSQRKHWVQSVDTEVGRLERSARKVPTTSNGDNNVSGSLELEKLKRIPRKVTNHQTEPLQEQPQNEFERVKHNLRKVSAPIAVASERSEAENEMEQPTPEKIPKSSAPEVNDQVAVDYSKQIADSGTEVLPETVTVDETVDVHNHPAAEQLLSINGGKDDRNPALTVGLSSKEDQTNKENQRTRRRKSLPAKQEYTENISQKMQSLPSYMAATASAKAKLKAQGAPNSTEDGAENNFVRRHSLPSSNGKFNLGLPQMQRKVQANGERGNKINKSISSSRDEKVLQPGWRR